MARPFWLLGLAAVLGWVGCGASPDELYKRGVASFKQGRLEPAVADLEGFVAKSCGPAGAPEHCRQAYLTLGHAYEKRNAPGKAWAAYDNALTFPPHGADGPIQTDRDRMKEMLSGKQQQETARAPVVVRYRDEVTEEYTGRSLTISLDFDPPIYSKDKDVGELHTPEFHRIFSGSVAAGEHVLVVEMAHDCNPNGGAKCARSRVHKAFAFERVERTPATLELRAYAEPADGDGPARPSLELVSR